MARGSTSWAIRDLRRPLTLLSVAFAFLGGLASTALAGCNVHEISHALVGTAVGWEVDRVELCPGGAQVVYARTTDAWYANAEGFAGGLGAAAFVAAVYALLIARRRRPIRSPLWWGVGLGAAGTIGAQLVIGGVEGVAGIRGWDYTETLDERRALWLAIVSAAMAVSGAVHVWRWRGVWAPEGSGRQAA